MEGTSDHCMSHTDQDMTKAYTDLFNFGRKGSFRNYSVADQ